MTLCYLLSPQDRIAATDFRLGDKAGQIYDAPVGSSGGIVTDQHYHFIRPLEEDHAINVMKAEIQAARDQLEAEKKLSKSLMDANALQAKLISEQRSQLAKAVFREEGPPDAHAIGEQGEQGPIGFPFGIAMVADPTLIGPRGEPLNPDLGPDMTKILPVVSEPAGVVELRAQ